MNDPWRHLRKDLFGNVEPKVTLEAVTVPVEYFDCEQGSTILPLRCNAPLCDEIQALPGMSARISYGPPLTIPKSIDLSRTIRQKGHMTPYESVQFNFHVSGISKSCGSQLSRHRIGQGHVSSSRRYQEQQPAFVYPMLEYVEDEKEVGAVLHNLEGIHYGAIEAYRYLREHVSKSDARRIIPISSAQERHWWVNARALRDFFRLRLAKDAEWEIRRLAGMVLDVVKGVTPVLFEDIEEGK